MNSNFQYLVIWFIFDLAKRYLRFLSKLDLGAINLNLTTIFCQFINDLSIELDIEYLYVKNECSCLLTFMRKGKILTGEIRVKISRMSSLENYLSTYQRRQGGHGESLAFNS